MASAESIVRDLEIEAITAPYGTAGRLRLAAREIARLRAALADAERERDEAREELSEWANAWDVMRDAILNDYGPLEINDVLGTIDYHDPRPLATPALLREAARALAAPAEREPQVYVASGRQEGKTLAGKRAIAEALGFDPENHHNAAACPFCNPPAPQRQEGQDGA